MDCFCGCGTKVPRKMTEVNLRLGETGLELLAWDRYRTIGGADRMQAEEANRLIDHGALCHRRLLATIHGEGNGQALEESSAWLEESRAIWERRPAMREGGSFLKPPRLRLSPDDVAKMDRIHPDRSFSGDPGAATPEPGPGPESASGPAADPAPAQAVTPAVGEELVGQLERLGSLRREGLLSEEEFAAAKARLIG